VDMLQTAGDKLREVLGNGYVAAKAIEQIAEFRSTQCLGNLDQI
jgi:hypothetical protein